MLTPARKDHAFRHQTKPNQIKLLEGLCLHHRASGRGDKPLLGDLGRGQNQDSPCKTAPSPSVRAEGAAAKNI